MYGKGWFWVHAAQQAHDLNVAEAIADSETRGDKLERLRVRLWLQADIQPPEIEVCSTPNNGHSEAHAGLPVLVESGCGAVAVGSACRFPPLSSGGASIAGP